MKKTTVQCLGEIPGKLDIKGKPIDRYLNPDPLLVPRLPSQVPWNAKSTVSSDMQMSFQSQCGRAARRFLTMVLLHLAPELKLLLVIGFYSTICL